MSNERQAFFYALAAVLLWSSVATAFKLALSYQPVIVLLAGASLTSCITLAVILLAQGRLSLAFHLLRRSLGQTVLLALINPIAYYLILFEAYSRLPAQVAQPVNYTWAIVLALLSVPVLGHRLYRRDLAGLLLGYVGVAIISIAGKEVTGKIDPIGLVLALSSTVLWAGFWLLNTRAKGDVVVRLFLNFLLATPALALAVWLLPDVDVNWRPAALLGAVYVGLFEMGITFVLWQSALKKTSHAARIGTLIFLSPFISLFLIGLILEEPLQWQTFVGLLFIVLGVSLAQSSHPLKPGRPADHGG